MTTTTIERAQVNWLTLTLWLVANLLSFGLVGAMFHNFPLAFTFPPNLMRLGSFSLLPALLGGALFGFVPALLIGFLQRFILRRHLPLSRWWIVSASAGMGLMHFLSDGFENARDLSLAVLISGMLVGVIQWRLLRPYVSSSAGWIVASGLGWFVGWLIGTAILYNTGLLYRSWVPGLDRQTHGILGLAVGAAFSVSTSLFWIQNPEGLKDP